MKTQTMRNAIIGVGLVVCLAMPVSAELFENYTRGGRVLGIGGAFVGGADDIYSLIYNPAGLSSLKGAAASFNYQPGFASEEVNALGAMAGYGFGAFAVGGSFYQLGQDGGLTMTSLVFAGSFRVPGGAIGPITDLRLGLNCNLYMLSIDGYTATAAEGFNANPSAFDLGVSVQFGFLTEALRIGIHANNLLEPSISFLGSGGGSKIKREIRVGASLLANEYLRINLDRAFRDYGYTSGILANMYLGAEVNFYKAVAFRFGFDEGKMTLGVGVTGAQFDVNAAIRIENNVNLYYQLDLTLKMN